MNDEKVTTRDLAYSCIMLGIIVGVGVVLWVNAETMVGMMLELSSEFLCEKLF